MTRTFAQQSRKPQAQSSLNFAQSGLVNRVAVHQTASFPRLPRAVENQAVKQALKAESERGSAAPAASTLGHNFSRIPIYAQEPATGPEEAADSGAESTNQNDCPPGSVSGKKFVAGILPVPLWVPGKHITPKFPLTRPAPIYLTGFDRTPSIATPDRAPAVTGRVAADCNAKVWRYQLTSFEAGGTIQIRYYPASFYPAPQPPPDDKAELKNVTKHNWQAIVDDLDKHKDDVPNEWSAYRREDLHEEYHWEIEWKSLVTRRLAELENKLEKLEVPFTPALPYVKPPTAAEAEATLEPQMQKELSTAYTAMLEAYGPSGSFPDKPKSISKKNKSDPAYIAQIPAFEFLIGRIKKHAQRQGWFSTPQKGEKNVQQSGK